MTTVPDSNVRTAWRRGAASARAARASALARLLLYVLQHLPQLDRKPLLLLFAASLTSACIIPLGPEFQDPPGQENAAPSFLAESPEEGRIVADETPTFSLTLTDVNVGDDLFVRRIFEFPPQTNDSRPDEPPARIPHSADGSRLRNVFSFSPTCENLNKAVTTHPITVAVSDSPFVGLLTTENGTPPTRATWIWIKNCQASP